LDINKNEEELRKQMTQVENVLSWGRLSINRLLKNGKTPENQTILSVLEEIADRIEEDSWRLKQEELTLF
jgi:DNA-binding phage protein